MKKSIKYSTKKIIGSLIKKHRLNKQLTQQQLADVLQSDRQYVWKIENGKINITLEYLDKIITKLKCNHSDFFKE